jgi:hypothetical protein
VVPRFHIVDTASDGEIQGRIEEWLGRPVQVRIPRPLGEGMNVEWIDLDLGTAEVALHQGKHRKYALVNCNLNNEALAPEIATWTGTEGRMKTHGCKRAVRLFNRG